jgi:hypothetical protein
LPSFGDFGRGALSQRQPGTGTIIGGLVFFGYLAQMLFRTRLSGT